MEMKRKIYSVPFGKEQLSFMLPPHMRGTVVKPNRIRPLGDVTSAIKQTLAHPIGSVPLGEFAKSGNTACIVFTDATRACPDHLLVPPLLAELEAAGVENKDITLLCGVGMHRPSTLAERIAKLGHDVASSYRIVDNEPQNPANLVDLGTTESGIPIVVNRIAYEADLIISTGSIEPHHLAGYSGGCKTLAIGAAGETTLTYSHGPQIADHPSTRLGNIEGNLFQEAVTETARRAGLNFIVNVVMDSNKQVLAVRAGEPRSVFLELVDFARSLYEVPISRQYDVVVAGVGFPKDQNLYQAGRAASYLFLVPTPVVRPGGCIIVPAPCPEGVGIGVGEQSYYNMMKTATSMSSLLTELRETGYPPGAQRAFFMAKVLEEITVIIVGAQYPDVVRALHMVQAADMTEALRIAEARLGRANLDVLILPHAMLSLPIVTGRRAHGLSASDHADAGAQ